MIPRANITAWRKTAPWPDNSQVEQDLVITRALVELFARPTVAEQAVFRGGTALHKLFFFPPGRYSEDIDLVQRTAGPIGPLVDEIRAVLDPWLGPPNASSRRWPSGLRAASLPCPWPPMRSCLWPNPRPTRGP